ncbi:MAG: phage holin family protein [Tannerella sp.]|jgi:putative membrane protein|nr:phage holin family protein [Tannerella sp.]
MNLLLKLLISSVAVFVTAWVLPGVSLKNFGTSILVAILLAVLNTFLKPVMQILSLPITILTLGLFLLVINTLIIMLASAIMGNRFHVNNFWWALLFSIILSLVTGLLEKIFASS